MTDRPEATPAERAAETVGETPAETVGETTGKTTGETARETGGETPAEIVGETTGKTAGGTAGETGGETPAETVGETTGKTAGETAGKTGGEALPEAGRQARFAAEVALAERADEVAVLDLRGLAGFTDFFVIAGAGSERRRRTIVEAVERRVRERFGRKPTHLEGYPASGWMLADYVDFLVHVFSPESRDLYRIDRLWGDADRWVPPAPPSPEADADSRAADSDPPAADLDRPPADFDPPPAAEPGEAAPPPGADDESGAETGDPGAGA